MLYTGDMSIFERLGFSKVSGAHNEKPKETYDVGGGDDEVVPREGAAGEMPETGPTLGDVIGHGEDGGPYPTNADPEGDKWEEKLKEAEKQIKKRREEEQGEQKKAA
jgi:hypothetical protein